MPPPQPLKDLLRLTVKKSRIGEQVVNAMIIEACNQWLAAVLPPGRSDAKAVSIRGTTIEIACLNSAAAQHIKSKEEECLAHLSQSVVNSAVDRLGTKIVSKFSSSEIM